MQVNQFLRSRQNDWKMLSGLLDRCQGNVRRLKPKDVTTLGALYRAATSDLALAQRDFPNHQVTVYLNQLVGRAHAILYRKEPLVVNRFMHFVIAGFPQVYRELFPYTLVATILFLIPALMAGIGTLIQPEAAHWLLPPEMQDVILQIEDQDLWVDIPVDERPYTSSFIMTNNLQVSFLAFSAGILGGVFTAWIMILNGVLLGTILGLTTYHGVGFEMATFVIGHGVIELSVIFMAGGAGLNLGWAVIRPGLMRRRDALALAANRAVRLVIGCIPLLVIAGVIEGFISPTTAFPWVVNWAVGLGSGILLYVYLLLAGHEKEAAFLNVPAEQHHVF